MIDKTSNQANNYPILPFDTSRFPHELQADIQEAVNDVLGRTPEQLSEIPLADDQSVAIHQLAPTPKVLLPNTEPKVVGLFGKPRSGKDTAAEYLLDKYHGVAIIVSSDQIIKEVNDYLAEYSYDSDKGPVCHFINHANKPEIHYRRLLQTWATARRAEDPSYWVTKLRKEIERVGSDGFKLMLVTGVRDPGEFDLIIEIGGLHWNPIRPDNTYEAEYITENMLNDVSAEHVIEILNDGTLEAFYERVEDTLKRTLNR